MHRLSSSCILPHFLQSVIIPKTLVRFSAVCLKKCKNTQNLCYMYFLQKCTKRLELKKYPVCVLQWYFLCNLRSRVRSIFGVHWDIWYVQSIILLLLMRNISPYKKMSFYYVVLSFINACAKNWEAPHIILERRYFLP